VFPEALSEDAVLLPRESGHSSSGIASGQIELESGLYTWYIACCARCGFESSEGRGEGRDGLETFGAMSQ
jgi:hypothetical protein